MCEIISILELLNYGFFDNVVSEDFQYCRRFCCLGQCNLRMVVVAGHVFATSAITYTIKLEFSLICISFEAIPIASSLAGDLYGKIDCSAVFIFLAGIRFERGEKKVKFF